METDEMRAVLEAVRVSRPGDTIVVASLPGSGKTTLMKRVITEEVKRGRRVLILMFNREPIRDFLNFASDSELVSCATFHQLAHHFATRKGHIMDATNDDELPHRVQRDLAARGISTENFECFVNMARCDKSAECAEVFGSWLAGPEALSLKAALRLIATEGSRDDLPPADIVVVDEAQDANFAMVALMKFFLDTSAVVLCGDTNQHINSFMFACDPIGRRADFFPGARAFSLSHSFRFGADIADAFNAVAHSGRCVGRGPPLVPPAERRDLMVLCRMNKELWRLATVLAQNGVSFAFYGASEEEHARRAAAFRTYDPAARVLLSTIHRAKGGGWSNVYVSAHSLCSKTASNDMRNLVSTALTRAKLMLFVDRSLGRCWNLPKTAAVVHVGSLMECVRRINGEGSKQ